jgi:hypothetical protein
MLSNNRITFTLPEVIYGPSLLFNPHVFLFGMLFHACAFRNKLTSMTRLQKLFVHKDCQQLLLPLDLEKREYYVFCKTKVVNSIPIIQHEQPDLAMGSQLRDFREIHGWKEHFFMHQFHYGSSKILNESGNPSFPHK